MSAGWSKNVMDIRQLRYFLRIVEAGSFSKPPKLFALRNRA